jgi:membrane protein implicated in regulation of membrane protease activity
MKPTGATSVTRLPTTPITVFHGLLLGFVVAALVTASLWLVLGHWPTLLTTVLATNAVIYLTAWLRNFRRIQEQTRLKTLYDRPAHGEGAQ